jgi:uncharacterized protein (DUF2126 family)
VGCHREHLAQAHSVAEKQVTDSIFSEVGILVRDSIDKMQLAGVEAAFGSPVNASKYTQSAVERLLLRLHGIEESQPNVEK